MTNIGEDREWVEKAACRNAPNPDIFFPATGLDYLPNDRGAAMAYCKRCWVAQECGTEALAFPQSWDWGIRGGMTANERKRIRDSRAATA